ncbi:MAG TPA: hypothetical protein VG929_07970 [Actinomycetota bacterium]|nr:hypothetical protein [Actinomycetota bacterium]
MDEPDARNDPWVPLACAAVTLFVALVPVLGALRVFGGHPSGMVRMAADEPMARLATEADAEFRFVDPGAHYDGVYFYAIALDPLARGEAHTLIDRSAYRYGHAGYGWVAGLVSFGRASAVPFALLLVGLVSLCVAAGALSLLSVRLGWTPWAGLVVAFHPGLLYALTALTSETLGAALLVVSLLLWARERHAAAAATLVALCLVKEPFVLVPIGLGLWELRRWWAARDNGIPVSRLALLSLGPLAFAVWYVYLRAQFGEWPSAATEGFFAFPFTGWWRSINEASSFAAGDFLTSQIGAASAPMLAAAAALLGTGLVVAARLRHVVDGPYLLLALLTLCLQPLGVLYPKDMIREVSMPLLLLPLVIALALRSRHTAGEDTPAPTRTD